MGECDCAACEKCREAMGENAVEVYRLRLRVAKLEAALERVVASEDDSYGVVTLAREALAPELPSTPSEGGNE